MVGNKKKIINFLLDKDDNKEFEVKEYTKKRTLNQNSMYLYALGDNEIKKSYCEWLKKGEIGKLEELYIVDYEEIKKLVKEYYKCMEEENE